ncbi:MAG: OadG family protein [Bacillota bacterium]
MEWAKVFSVAFTGILSVFLGLGILSLAVGLTGYIFEQSAKRKAKESSISPANNAALQGN